MLDALFLALTLFVFLVAAAYVSGCRRLERGER